ncbi:mucin-3A-like [Mixophyes fleayi]|uniref:mucin-3A-like n=1 Tax=Mixophyes fleayi TaxID=3061075 RepID=UPI003F4E3AA1
MTTKMTTSQPTTISTTQPPTSSPTTVPGIRCENGGVYNGKKCVCKDNFIGAKCEFVLPEYKTTVIIVRVKVTVTINDAFNVILNDKNSLEYKEFELRFETKMIKFYRDQNIKCEGIKINSLSPGSIIADHDVLMETDFNNATEQQQEAADLIKQTLNMTNCTPGEDDPLCFIPNSVKAVAKEIQLEELCADSMKLSPEIGQHYYAVFTTDGLICMTNCSTENNYTLDCNNGQCSVTNKGPQCYCEISDQYWYTGDRCQLALSKPGVYAGLAVGLFVLLIIILVLAIFLRRSQNRSEKVNLMDPGEQWNEDEWEEDTYDRNIVKNNGTEGFHHSISSGNNFKLSLERVDPNVNITIRRPKIIFPESIQQLPADANTLYFPSSGIRDYVI